MGLKNMLSSTLFLRNFTIGTTLSILFAMFSPTFVKFIKTYFYLLCFIYPLFSDFIDTFLICLVVLVLPVMSLLIFHIFL